LIPDSEILLPGESILGNYNAAVARWSTDRWVSTIPALYAAVTQQRLILRPQARKRYEPAIIPGRSILNIEAKTLATGNNNHRQGVVIRLKQNYHFTLFINPRDSGNFVQYIRAMAALPPSKTYEPPLEPDALQKLINFLESLSV
jgi:hypothetical protein